MSDIQSRPYRPDFACERCCFGSGDHANFCPEQFRWMQQFQLDLMRSSPSPPWIIPWMAEKASWIDDYFDGEFHSEGVIITKPEVPKSK